MALINGSQINGTNLQCNGGLYMFASKLSSLGKPLLKNTS